MLGCEGSSETRWEELESDWIGLMHGWGRAGAHLPKMAMALPASLFRLVVFPTFRTTPFYDIQWEFYFYFFIYIFLSCMSSIDGSSSTPDSLDAFLTPGQ